MSPCQLTFLSNIVKNPLMKDQNSDPRAHAILMSAWQAFATYGYRKTSMDDIARGAGMSRPALYLHYRNKDDIFRSLVHMYYDSTAQRVAEALGDNSDPATVLAAAFRGQMGEAMEAMLTSPHGMELFDTGAATAADIKQAGEARLQELYADWLARSETAGRLRLPDTPDKVAATLITALKGIKTSGAGYGDVLTRLDVLARVFGNGLAAG